MDESKAFDVFCSFEESVSLMSAESLQSQETSSGNFETDGPAVPKTIARADSSGSNDTTNSNTTNSRSSNSSNGPTAVRGTTKTTVRAAPSLGRSDSLKSSSRSTAARKTESPAKRTSSFRTAAVQKPAATRVPVAPVRSVTGTVARPANARASNAPKPVVERSGSKSSLRSSSRSSLNSTNSAGTVKRTAAGVSTYTRAIDDLTAGLKTKKPLNALRTYNRNAYAPQVNGRSSSGGVAASAVDKPKPKPSGTSSKENNNSHHGAAAAAATTTAVTGRPLGFMRPTASSTAKDSIDGAAGVKPKSLVKKNFKY